MPAEMIAEMRQCLPCPALEATAHTLIYDSLIPGTMPLERLAAISTPALVVASESSGGQLRDWGREVAGAFPNASAHLLPGTWHGISADHLAPAPREFFTSP